MSDPYKFGVSGVIEFPLIDFGKTDFENTPVTFVAADVQIMKDGGAFANTTNTLSHAGNGIYSLTLTAAEMSAARIVVTVIDQTGGPKEWEDQAIRILTVGNASAHLAFDLGAANVTVGTIVAAALDAIWDEIMTGSTSARQTMRLLQATDGGKLSGSPAGPIKIRDIADTKDVIEATVDSNGNRTSIVRDLS